MPQTQPTNDKPDYVITHHGVQLVCRTESGPRGDTWYQECAANRVHGKWHRSADQAAAGSTDYAGPGRSPDLLGEMIQPAMAPAEQLALAYSMILEVDGDLAVITSALRSSVDEATHDAAWELLERAT